ncbi:MAG: hypothetical protein IJ815_01915 [Lachnospiraceae bacterium]|nr:hypothetical protein [Lachnospiraceae bacterium]
MRMLYTVYNKPVILLIDEYDVPLASAREKYAEGLYGYKQILCYGIAFYQKGAKVRKA